MHDPKKSYITGTHSWSYDCYVLFGTHNPTLTHSYITSTLTEPDYYCHTAMLQLIEKECSHSCLEAARVACLMEHNLQLHPN